MLAEFVRGFALLIIFTAITGGAYPLLVTAIAQFSMPAQANGSMIEKDGQLVGSALIGQGFADVKYFWPRPSAAGSGYDGANSSGSNLAPSSAKLLAAVTDKAKTISAVSDGRDVPVDLVTSSASGLDPHITPLSAYLQVLRIAKARGVREEEVRSVVRDNLEEPTLGVFGEERVNVLRMNLALDALPPK